MTIAIPPNGVNSMPVAGGGIGFATGIAYTIVTGSADADTTATTAGAVDCCNRAYCSDPGAGVDGHTGAVLGHAAPCDGRLGGRWRMAGGLVRSHHQTRFGGA